MASLLEMGMTISWPHARVLGELGYGQTACPVTAFGPRHHVDLALSRRRSFPLGLERRARVYQTERWDEVRRDTHPGGDQQPEQQPAILRNTPNRPHLPFSGFAPISQSSPMASCSARLFLVCLLSLGVLVHVGCGPKDKAPVIVASELPVRILVLDDPELAESIESTWSAQGEGEINVTQKAADAVLESPRKVLDADLVVYPVELLVALAERDLLAPLAADTRRDPMLAFNDYFPSIRLTTTSWDRQSMAASFGEAELMVMYRQDMLDHLGAAPPQTWADYDRLAKQLADADAMGPFATEDWLGAVEPHSLRAALLLARAGSYSGDETAVSTAWEYRSMEPKLTTPPFLRALTRMKRNGVNRSLETPGDCYRALLEGSCGMAICWPARHAIEDLELPDPLPPLRCAALPGAGEVVRNGVWMPVGAPHRNPLVGISGRLISVTREAQRRDTAAARLVWLAGKELGERIALASHATMPCRTSTRQLSRWTGDSLDDEGLSSYTDVLQQAAERATAQVLIRIPGRQRYLQSLEDALDSSAEPTEALQQAADQWEQITNELGRRKQKEALGNSLAL